VGAAANAGNAEVVAHDGNPRLADAPDDGLDVLELLFFLRAVQQNVVPMGGIEIFDGFELESGGVDFLAQRNQFCERPEVVRIAGPAPTLVSAGG